MPVILFQGDSITDAGRNRTVAPRTMRRRSAAAIRCLRRRSMLRAHPDGGAALFNRGVSGDKVPALAGALGDGHHRAQAGHPEHSRRRERSLAQAHGRLRRHGRVTTRRNIVNCSPRTEQALPNVRFVILEPFVLVTGAVDARWFPEFDERRAAAARVANSARARRSSRLQSMFTQLASSAPPVVLAGGRRASRPSRGTRRSPIAGGRPSASDVVSFHARDRSSPEFELCRRPHVCRTRRPGFRAARSTARAVLRGTGAVRPFDSRACPKIRRIPTRRSSKTRRCSRRAATCSRGPARRAARAK